MPNLILLTLVPSRQPPALGIENPANDTRGQNIDEQVGESFLAQGRKLKAVKVLVGLKRVDTWSGENINFGAEVVFGGTREE